MHGKVGTPLDLTAWLGVAIAKVLIRLWEKLCEVGARYDPGVCAIVPSAAGTRTHAQRGSSTRRFVGLASF